MEYVVCDAVRYVTFICFENFTSWNSYVVCGATCCVTLRHVTVYIMLLYVMQQHT
jgi:hypothetical protein